MTDPSRPPPPDPNKPYVWVNGQWLLVATDTSDGVPDSLEFDQPKGEQGKAGNGQDRRR